MDVGLFAVSVDVPDKGAFDLFSDVAADGVDVDDEAEDDEVVGDEDADDEVVGDEVADDEAVDDEAVGDESVDDVAVDGGDWGLLSGTAPQPVKRRRTETARERTAGAGILVKRDRLLLLDIMVPPV